jgi:hypothetical protein
MIEDLFRGAPSLTGFTLAELRWGHQEKYFELRGTLSSFPRIHLPHWEPDANRLGLRLLLEEVSFFEIQGWDYENRIDLEIEVQSEDNVLVVRGVGEEVSFEVICGGLDVSEVYAYHSPDSGHSPDSSHSPDSASPKTDPLT